MSKHLDGRQLEMFRRRSGSAEELLAIDDHLALCTSCRLRVRESLGRPEGPLSTAFGPDEESEHLTYKQLADYVRGRRLDDPGTVEAHLEACDLCRAESQDLQQFAADVSRVGRSAPRVSGATGNSPRIEGALTPEEFLERYGPSLIRWAKVQLSKSGFDSRGTSHLVYEVLSRVRLPVNVENPNALAIYLRVALYRRARDFARRRAKHSAVRGDDAPRPLGARRQPTDLSQYESALKAGSSDVDLIDGLGNSNLTLPELGELLKVSVYMPAEAATGTTAPEGASPGVFRKIASSVLNAVLSWP
jgi:hypothetical protein